MEQTPYTIRRQPLSFALANILVPVLVVELSDLLIVPVQTRSNLTGAVALAARADMATVGLPCTETSLPTSSLLIRH